MVTQVRSYKASDGKLFSVRSEALKHERFIEVRGIFNRSLRARPSDKTEFSSTEVTNILLANQEEIRNIFTRYNKMLSQIEKKPEVIA